MRLVDLKTHIKKHHSTTQSSGGVGPIRSSKRNSIMLRHRGSVSSLRDPSGSHTLTHPSPLARSAALADDDDDEVEESIESAQMDQAMTDLSIHSPQPDMQPMDTSTHHFTENGDAPMPSSTASQCAWAIVQPELLAKAGMGILMPVRLVICLPCQRCLPSHNVIGHLADKHKDRSISQAALTQIQRDHNIRATGNVKDTVEALRVSRSYTPCPWLAQRSGWWCQEASMVGENEHDTWRLSSQEGRSGQRHGPKPIPLQLRWIDTLRWDYGLISDFPSSVLLHRMRQDRMRFKPPIIALEDPRSVHPFLKISGFQRWIGGMSWWQVEGLQTLCAWKTQGWGDALLQHCIRVMESSFGLCTAINYVACCLVNSPTVVIKTMSFGEVGDNTKKRYASVWAGFISMLIKGRAMLPEARRFSLSDLQDSQLGVYIEYLEMETPQSSEDVDMGAEALALLSLVLLQDELGSNNSAEHPLVSYTILSSIKPGNIVADPVHISPFLASLEYFCRVTVLVLAKVASLDASEPVTFFQAVVSLTPFIKEGHNTPFAWIRQMLHLTGAFARSTNRASRFVWSIEEPNTYTFDGYRIRLDEFKSMVRGSVVEAVHAFFELWDAYSIPRDLVPELSINIGDELASAPKTTTSFDIQPMPPWQISRRDA
ncbi:hypothetical protein FRB90_010764 [Tulasnella sp. 427]|nr:hypothetical protein FRB90_010764 [Tulasnella sp. 427]